MGEMVAGILLGPSLLGRIAPGLFHSLFTAPSPLPLTVLSQIGLILLMFQIGLEFDFGHLKLGTNRKAVTAIWLAGIALPAALGAGLGWVSHDAFAPAVPRGVYVFFMAVSLSITAMPVLGRIILELNLNRTRIGTLAMTSAAFGDVVGWFLLAAVVALARSGTGGVPIMMNTRGLLELVVANVGYELGIIPRTIFTMLVFMALFSTALTVPCLRAWLPRVK